MCLMVRISIFLILIVFYASFSKAQEAQLSIPSGHSKDVSKLLFSPDGKYLLSFGNEWILWDVNTGKQIRQFDSKADYGYTANFSQDGQTLAVSNGGFVEIFHISDDRPIKTLISEDGRYYEGIFINNDAKIVLRLEKKLEVYSYPEYKLLKTLTFENEVSKVTNSKDSLSFIVGLRNREVLIYDIETFEEEKLFHKLHNPEFRYGNFFAFEPLDDNQMFACCPEEGYINCTRWNIDNGEILKTFRLKDLDDFNISADGKIAAFNYSYYHEDHGYLYFLNTLYGTVVDSIQDQSNSFAMHPNNRWLAYGDNNDIILYDRVSKEIVKTFAGLSEGLGDIWFTENMNTMYFCKYYNYGIFQMNTKSHATYENKYFFLADHIKTSKDGVIGYKVDDLTKKTNDYSKNYGFIRIVNYKTGEVLKETKTSYIYQICDISPDLRYALCKDYNYDEKEKHTVAIIDLEKDKIVSEFSYFQSSDRGKPFYRFTKDSKHIVVFNYDCLFHFEPQLFRANRLKPKDEFSNNSYKYDQSHQVSCIDMSADRSLIASGSIKGGIVVYDIENRTATQKFFHKKATISDLKISEDKSKCAAVVGNDIVVFDMKSGEKLVIYSESNPLNELNFSPDAEFLLALFDNNTNKIYNLKGRELAKFVAFKSGDWAVTTPDGRFDGTEKGIEMLQFVKGMNVYPLEILFDKFYQPNLLELALGGNLKEMTFEANVADTLQSRMNEAKINKLLPAPVVSFLSPGNNTKSETSEITVGISIDSRGADIDEILLFHNSKLIKGSDRGFKNLGSKEKTKREYTIQLVNGENIIKATAFNHQRTESIPAEIKVLYKGEEKKSSLYVLAIGINEYKNSNLNLNYAIPDAEALVKYLNYGSAQIFKDIHVHFIKNSEATKAAIISEIEKIKNEASAEDVFVFYYAGHGVMGDEIEGIKADYYLVPHDVTQLYGNEEVLVEKAISSNEIMKYSTEIKAQKQLLIMDACQSGGAIETFASRGAAEQKAIMQLARSTGIMVLAASGSEQFATEFNELGHGAFTYALLEGLKCQADGGKKDFKITVSELKAFLEDRLPELTEKYKGKAQYPTGYSRGQDFPIVICK